MKIAVGAGKSLNFGANFIQPRQILKCLKEQAQNDLHDTIAHVGEELEKTWAQGSFSY